MKKILAATIIITACAALCAAVWPRGAEVGIVPVEAEIATLNAEVDALLEMHANTAEAPADDEPVAPPMEIATLEKTKVSPEKEEPVLLKTSAEPKQEAPTPASSTTPTEPIPSPPATPPTTADPYHTDVYPNNVYSEEFIYDKVGNLIGKATTIPTEFGPDTIWVDGRAYYDVPGFGLVEWSGPGQCIEDYTMYESGVKVGIMGGDDEAPTHRAPTTPPPDWPEPTGEVIDQTINTKPERNSTPPDYKPETTPPADPSARE